MLKRSVTVIKIGGGPGIDLDSTCADIAERARRGRRIVVVHGASHAANRLTEARGLEPRFLTSPSGHVSRHTTPEVRDIFVEAAHGMTRRISAALRDRGVQARSMSGEDCPLRGQRKQAIRALVAGRQVVVRDDYSGQIIRVEVSKIAASLRQGAIPVVPPLAHSGRDGLLNVDGDRAAAAIAAEVGAERLLILSDVPGLMREYPDPDSVVPDLASHELGRAMQWAEGPMKRKLLSVSEALDGGVPQVVLADGRASSPVRRGLRGEGTRFHD